MNIGKIDILEKYIKKQKNNELKKHINIWRDKTNNAEWKCQDDIRNTFTKASFLPHNRVVFNIVGGSYRLSVIVVYVIDFVSIEWIGTHGEYDRLDLTKKTIIFK
jgi:mRNA interferase HigB